MFYFGSWEHNLAGHPISGEPFDYWAALLGSDPFEPAIVNCAAVGAGETCPSRCTSCGHFDFDQLHCPGTEEKLHQVVQDHCTCSSILCDGDPCICRADECPDGGASCACALQSITSCAETFETRRNDFEITCAGGNLAADFLEAYYGTPAKGSAFNSSIVFQARRRAPPPCTAPPKHALRPQGPTASPPAVTVVVPRRWRTGASTAGGRTTGSGTRSY
jgi:hypothetical protein